LSRRLPPVQESLIRLHDLSHPPPPGTEGVSTDVGVLRLPEEDSVMLPWLREYGRWETDESRLLDVLLPTGGVFVDIGAHVGYFTVRALQRVGAAGLVVAVEPSAEICELLRHNVAANVPAPAAAQLTILQGAAWDVDGIRLDGAPCFAGRKVDVVKCYAQGRDHRALAGMTGLFELRLPHILCQFDPRAIASGGDDPAEVLLTYRSWGYVPLCVTRELVTTIESDGIHSIDVGSPPSDNELIDGARRAAEGSVTLWLRPPSSESRM
jgi:hypothetical protein